MAQSLVFYLEEKLQRWLKNKPFTKRTKKSWNTSEKREIKLNHLESVKSLSLEIIYLAPPTTAASKNLLSVLYCVLFEETTGSTIHINLNFMVILGKINWLIKIIP